MPPAPVTPPTMPTPLLLNRHEAARVLGIGLSTFERYVSAGFAPRPVRLGNCVRWRADELREWIENGCQRAI